MRVLNFDMYYFLYLDYKCSLRKEKTFQNDNRMEKRNIFKTVLNTSQNLFLVLVNCVFFLTCPKFFLTRKTLPNDPWPRTLSRSKCDGWAFSQPSLVMSVTSISCEELLDDDVGSLSSTNVVSSSGFSLADLQKWNQNTQIKQT